jgi:hypothetical protein
MAMFTIYFDDSGTHRESPVAIAACWLSDASRWAKFDQRWSAASTDPVDGFGVFHASEFNAAPYTEKSKRTLDKVCGIIKDHVLLGAIAAVVKDDYDKVVTGKLREKLGEHHYTFAVQSCLAHIEEWRKGRGGAGDLSDEPFQYVFDRMSQGKPEIDNLFDDLVRFGLAKEFGIEAGGWSYQNRATFLPLQAADILAWEGYTYMRKCQLRTAETKKEPRTSFQSLVDDVDIWTRFFDQDKLQEATALMSAKYDELGWDNSARGGFVL